MANVASGQPVALPVNRPFVFGDLPKRGARICRLAMIVIGGALAVPSPGGGARADDSALLEPDRLLDLSLTDLLDVRVISAAKKEQRLGDVPAAMTVLTGEEILRSGASNIADVLRLVPGIVVGRIDGNQWAISSRGANGRFANKLLVLVDGRSVYNHLYGGVFWESLDYPLQDIERIEIVRGPGSVVWGANAVNGVINIITRSAHNTEGTVGTAAGGSAERFQGSIRQGGQAGAASYRVYGKYTERYRSERGTAGSPDDSWEHGQAGFRLDATVGTANEVFLTGDFYRGELGSQIVIPSLEIPYRLVLVNRDPSNGGNFAGAWTHRMAVGSVTFRSYFDWMDRDFEFMRYQANVFNVEATSQIRASSSHEITFGLEARNIWDRAVSPDEYLMSWSQNGLTRGLVSGFANHDGRWLNGRLLTVAGLRMERLSTESHWELQPSARALVHLHPQHSFWTAATRSVRMPSRGEKDVWIAQAVIPPDSRSPGAPPTVVAVTGNPSVEAEEVRTYEIGYRFDLSDHSHFEAAAFASQYQSLLAVVQGEPSVLTFSTGPAVVIPLNIGNDSRRSTKGVELSWTWSPSRDLRFTTGYSWLHQDNKNADLTETGGANPAHTAFSWTSWEAGRGLSLDTILRYVDNLPSYSIPAYLAADVRVSRRWPGTVATSLSIRDLFAPNHREYQSDVIPTVTTSVDPSVRLEVSLGL